LAVSVRKLLWLIVLVCGVLLAGAVSSAAPAGDARLSADRMRFDSRTGDFLAVGDVLIQTGGLTVRAPRGTGNAERREARFAEGIAASGDWQGDRIDLKAGSLSLYFAQTPTYTAEGNVKGDVGRLSIDADKLYMKGADLSAVGVRRLEDRESGVAFGAARVEGALSDGVLTVLTAKGNVWVRGRPGAKGETVDIWGETAVYSAERGSVVLSGNVRAVQKGRTLASRSLVYFPSDNRLEAVGDRSEGGAPARITIDMDREKSRK
jgi:lipopolysaccharide export system protein LptA